MAMLTLRSALTASVDAEGEWCAPEVTDAPSSSGGLPSRDVHGRAGSLAVVLVAALASSAGAAETWVEARSPNFTVVSNAGEGRARDIAWEFEQARVVFARLWPWAKLGQGRPVVVLVAKDEGTLKRWAPHYWEVKGGIRPASLSARGADREYLLVRSDTGTTDSTDVTPYFTVYRAYVSILLSVSLDRPLPVWLEVGMGEVFGNTSVRNSEVRVGRPVPWHVQQLNERTGESLKSILAAQRDSVLVRKEAERQLFDAQCWALVHYLFFGDAGAHAKPLGRFVQLWLAGRTQDQAWAETIGDVTLVEAKVNAYPRLPALSFGRLLTDVSLERQRFPVRPLAPGESAALRAEVHVALNRAGEAQDAIEESRAADPRGPASYDAEGLLADLQQNKVRATQAYAQAVERGSTSGYSYYRAAFLAWKPTPDPEGLAAIRKLLERSIELNEQFGPARSYLADVMVEQNQAAAALPLAERAVELDAGNSYARVTLAHVLHKLGEDGPARTSAQRGLELADDDQQKSNARSFLTLLDQEAENQRQRDANQATQSRYTACRNGDGAACAQLLPDLERWCGEGQANACDFAGWLFAEGRGVPTDLARAASFEQRGCAAGDKHDCVKYAWSQARGEGVTTDEKQGMATLGALCAEKFLMACTRLAALHAAKPTAEDRARARELLAQACEGGDVEACSLAKTLPR
jgi:hypothetical protein